MFRIKDTITGKYMSTGKYSYSSLSWNRKGRTYRELQYIQSSLEGRKYQFYEWIHAQELEKLDVYSRNQYIRIHTPKTWDFIPDTIVIEHYYTGEVVSTLKEFMGRDK
jgi:hypothetical protein